MTINAPRSDRADIKTDQLLTLSIPVTFHILQGNEKFVHVLTLSVQVGLEDIIHDEVQAESRLYH